MGKKMIVFIRWEMVEKCAFHNVNTPCVIILNVFVMLTYSALVLERWAIRSSGFWPCLPTRRFSLQRDTWTGRWPCSRPLPWGCIPFSPWPSLSAKTTERWRNVSFFLRRSPDRELERLIKLVKQNAIIEASSLQIPPEKTSFSPYLFPKCERAFSSYLNSLSGIIQGL